MTPAEKKAAYAAAQREREAQRRDALGLPAWSPPAAKRGPRVARVHRHVETYEDRMDDLGESHD